MIKFGFLPPGESGAYSQAQPSRRQSPWITRRRTSSRCGFPIISFLNVIFEFSAETRKPSRDGFISGFLETRRCDRIGAEMFAIFKLKDSIERGIRDNMKKNLASHVLLRAANVMIK
uniref:Uncharacterized protein n=1 Tax=Strigamia maritima TaxID=126957 RepID=T1J6Z4_STRMM